MSSPESGAPREWQAEVGPKLAETMAAEAVAGVVLAVARGDGPAEHIVAGVDAAGQPLGAGSLFPVASLTKLATALAALRLSAAGALALDAPLSALLPDAAAARPGVTPRRLLCHTSGLPVDLSPAAAPYAPGLSWPALARACLATPLTAPPGSRVCYSNVGFGLLAVAVERLTGLGFADALAQLVLGPLGVEGYLGAEPPRPVARIGGRLGEHAGTALEPYNSAFWRSLALPWAGLVTTAAGALALVRAFGGVPGGFLPPAICADATRDQSDGLAGGTPGFLEWERCPWGLGVELRGDKRPYFVPGSATPAAYGHAGGSGCLAYAVPAAGVAWAMLGTRTLPGWWIRWPGIGAAILTGA